MRKKYKLFFYSGLAIHLHLLFSNSLQSEGFTYLQGLNLKPSIRTLKFQGSKKTFCKYLKLFTSLETLFS